MDLLKQDQERKKAVMALLESTASYYDGLQESDKAEAFRKLKEDTANGKFSITVVGEFSAGKSTFLNALMKERYLPSFQEETTATVNFLRSVKESPTGKPLIRVNYKNGNVKTDDEVTLAKITDYVSTQGDNVATTISSVDVYLDSPFLNDGVCLVDSPGLNGIKEGHEDITRQQIKESHAAIYMFSCPQPGSKSDFQVLKDLTKECNSIFIVLNRIDLVRQSEESVDNVIEKLQEDYKTLFPNAKVPEIWPLSSYLALVSRSKGKLDLYNKMDHTDAEKAQYLKNSRIEAFENRLLKFLTQGEKNKKALVEPLDKIEKQLETTSAQLRSEIEILSNDASSEEISNKIDLLTNESVALDNKISDSKSELKSKIKDIIKDAKNSIKNETNDIKNQYIAKIGNAEEMEELQANAQRYMRIINDEYLSVYQNVAARLDDEFKDMMVSQFSNLANEIESKISENKSDSSINLDVMRIDLSQFEEDADVEEFLRRKEDLYKKIDAIEESIDENDNEIMRIRQQQKRYEQLKQQQSELRKEQEEQLERLGTRPEARVTTETTYVKKWKWWLIIPSRTLVPETSTKIDTTDQDNWDKSKKEIEAQYRDDLDEIKQKLKNLPEDSDEYEFQNRKLERKIDQLHREIEQLNSEMAESAKAQQKKAQRNAKRYLEDCIYEFEKTGRDAIIKQLETQDKNMLETAEFIIRTSLEDVLAAKKKEMETLQMQLQTSKEDRDKTIAAKQKQIADAMAIRKQTSDLLSEMEAIKIDKIKTE